MSRRYDARDILKYCTRVEKYWVQAGTIGDTTLTAALTSMPAATFAVTATTNFTAGDPIFLVGTNGDFELNSYASAASLVVTPGQPVLVPMPIGARVVEAQKADLGWTDESGVTLTGSAQITDILAAQSRLPVLSYTNSGQLGGSFNLRGFNIPNLQTVFGIPEAALGSGTSAAPFGGPIRGTQIGTEGLLCFRFSGTMGDGVSVAQVDFCGVTPTPNVNTPLGGSTPAVLGVSFRCTTIVPRIWT